MERGQFQDISRATRPAKGTTAKIGFFNRSPVEVQVLSPAPNIDISRFSGFEARIFLLYHWKVTGKGNGGGAQKNRPAAKRGTRLWKKSPLSAGEVTILVQELQPIAARFKYRIFSLIRLTAVFFMKGGIW
ncbi:hypothetical protein [Neomoorella thermoacetica]|uniref:hypothetical protein n=1 Tax=Neomoorella thermoacetica TaxID=1525 RepID=UPI0008F9F239|nr:hypothetical protein [Moorella thermoacetica]